MSIQNSHTTKNIHNKNLMYGKNNELYNNDYNQNINCKKISIADEIEKMKQRRENRKRKIEEEKIHKQEIINDPNYIEKLDSDYEYLIKEKKKIIELNKPKKHTTSENSKIFVCVRKRPIFEKEIKNGEIDCISAINPKIYIYESKMKIDGYSKYIDTNEFYFDNSFNENESSETLYNYTIKPNINLLLKKGVITVFAYGQTGSGKTYTMSSIQNLSIYSIFNNFESNKYNFYISFFEIYSGRLYDLLNNRNKVMALEDKNNKVQIYNLTEKKISSPNEMINIVEFANKVRTTHNTVTNETSSRSHAICNFIIKEKNSDEEFSKLTLVDLAGSERATETQSNNKNRLAEGAEINKSLLALKECIRALEVKGKNLEVHVPFRTSKLTLVLRDSFIDKNQNSKIIMIACVSPGYSSSNHTINTLRYADRLKEKSMKYKVNNNNNNNYSNNINNNVNNSNYINGKTFDEQIEKIGKNYNLKNVKYERQSAHLSKNRKLKLNNNNNSYHSSYRVNTNDINGNKIPNRLIKYNNDNKNKRGKSVNMRRNINSVNPSQIRRHLMDKLRKESSYKSNKSKNNNSLKELNETNDNDDNEKDINEYLNNEDFEDVEEHLEKTPIPFNHQLECFKPNYKKNVMRNDYHNNYNDFSNNIYNNEIIQFPYTPYSDRKKNEKKSKTYQRSIIEKKEKIFDDELNNLNVKEDYIEDNNYNNKIINDFKDEDVVDIFEVGENIISEHMNIIKREASLLSEEGKLISKLKGVDNENNFNMEDYTPYLDNIINEKIDLYKELKRKIQEYKNLTKE